MLSWVSITALGYAVVPEVNWMSRVSSGRTSLARRSSSASVTSAPSARNSLQPRAALGRSSPITITSRSSGSIAPGNDWSTAGSAVRSNDTKSMLRNRSAMNSAVTSARARQKPSSADLKRVLIGTVTAPSIAAP